MDVFGHAAEWTAVALNIAGSWMVGSTHERYQRRGFALLLCSNVAWMGWSWYDGAWGLFSMQIAFIAINIRGMRNHADHARSSDVQGKGPTR